VCVVGYRSRRLNRGLVVALDFFQSVLDRACFCVMFLLSCCMLCLVRYLFVIGISTIDCLGRFVSEIIYYVSSWMLNVTNKLVSWHMQQWLQFQLIKAHQRQQFGIMLNHDIYLGQTRHSIVTHHPSSNRRS